MKEFVVAATARPRGRPGGDVKPVAPTLYIASGISGAIQHLAGMRYIADKAIR